MESGSTQKKVLYASWTSFRELVGAETDRDKYALM
jgi:hypothetical protein